MVKTRIVNHNHIPRLQLRHSAYLQPHLKQISIASTYKRQGSKQTSCFQGGNPTDSLGALARLERMEPLPNLAVAIGVIRSVIDARFIHINNLMRQLAL
jgi:hypothetical protein